MKGTGGCRRLTAVQIAQLLDETGMIKPAGGYRSLTV